MHAKNLVSGDETRVIMEVNVKNDLPLKPVLSVVTCVYKIASKFISPKPHGVISTTSVKSLLLKFLYSQIEFVAIC